MFTVNYLLNYGYIVLDNPRRTVKVGGKVVQNCDFRVYKIEGARWLINV